MPPHNDYVQQLGYTTYTPYITPETIVDTRVINTITADDKTYIHTYNYNFVSNDQLNYAMEKFSRKIYKIISEHTNIDISEDEFMELLKEGE